MIIIEKIWKQLSKKGESLGVVNTGSYGEIVSEFFE